MPVACNELVRGGDYRAGIIGCGRIGCGFDDDPERGYVSSHAGAYALTPGVELVALADLEQAKLDRYGEKYAVAGRYQDYHQMLATENLDILSICTWNNFHRNMVEDAVAAGIKAVFCEKPIADSLEAADAMIQLCAESGVVLMVDHQRRFDLCHQQVASYLKAGGLGTVHQVTCYYTAGVANTGIHLFDLLRFFFGEVQWVQAIYSHCQSPDPQDPNVDGWLKFHDGPMVAVQACDVRSYTIFEVNILGTSGRLRVMSAGLDLQFEESRESKQFSGYQELFPAPCPIDSSGSHEFMLQGVSHLLECLEQGKTPICSGQDGRRSLEIVCALRTSADGDGLRVALPLKESAITIQSR